MELTCENLPETLDNLRAFNNLTAFYILRGVLQCDGGLQSDGVLQYVGDSLVQHRSVSVDGEAARGGLVLAVPVLEHEVGGVGAGVSGRVQRARPLSAPRLLRGWRYHRRYHLVFHFVRYFVDARCGRMLVSDFD